MLPTIFLDEDQGDRAEVAEPAPRVADRPWVVHHGDCLRVLPTIPDDSVDLVVTDPPYFRVKDEEWDNQWGSSDEFLAWLDRVLVELARVLRPNGSLYLFASPQMSARVECLVGSRFEVLNRITWRKERGKHKQACKEELRSFFPASESIVFAEHRGSDNRAKGEPGYDAKCDELRGFVFEPLRAYFEAARRASGLSAEQIRDGMQRLTGKRFVFERHAFSRSQWELPTEEQYAAAQTLFGTGPLDRPYQNLNRSYQSLKAQYEALRRPFAVTAGVQYTDVWEFETVQHRPGKHACEKPVDLCAHMVASSSRPDAVVLDAFCGSGAVGEAALAAGRRFIGIEADERWCREASRRLARVEDGR